MWIKETERSVKCRVWEDRRSGKYRNASLIFAKHFMEKKHKFINPTEKFWDIESREQILRNEVKRRINNITKEKE